MNDLGILCLFFAFGKIWNWKGRTNNKRVVGGDIAG